MKSSGVKRIFRYILNHPGKSIAVLFKKYPSDIPIRKILRLLPENAIIFEAGAGFGVHTQIFANSFPKGSIIAIEPVPEVFAVAKEKIKDLQNVELLQVALAENGLKNLEMFINAAHPHESNSGLEPTDDFLTLYKGVTFPNKIQVEALTLDELSAKFGVIDLLWLDLQGMEYRILANGGQKTLRRCHYVHLEVSVEPLYFNEAESTQIRNFMSAQGFQVIYQALGIAYGNLLYKNESINK